ncbi:MAG: thioredoxin family protein [Gemmataceae bacterium]|nr:thioredoxin family protein [Gemmataceae bacterium]
MNAWMCAVLLGLSCGTVAAEVPEAAGQRPRGRWYGDLRSGMAEARRSGKPLFVVFRCQP